jgi:hypothetical protein
MEEKRASTRQSISYPGRIYAGDQSPMRECTLHDVSEHGAQVVLTEPSELPEQFILILGYDGTVRRRCRVAWRSDKAVGVEFLNGAPAGTPKAPAAASGETGVKETARSESGGGTKPSH